MGETLAQGDASGGRVVIVIQQLIEFFDKGRKSILIMLDCDPGGQVTQSFILAITHRAYPGFGLCSRQLSTAQTATAS
jgi:hypothetical protein